MITNTITLSLLALASAAQGFKFTGPKGDSLNVSDSITITWDKGNTTGETFGLFWYMHPDPLYTYSSQISTDVNMTEGKYVWTPTEKTHKELKKYEDAVTENKTVRFEADFSESDREAAIIYGDNYTIVGLQDTVNAGSLAMPAWGLVAGGLVAAGVMMA